MRIVGGEHKGFQFHPPNNIPARPTTDFAKEALFNILNNQFYFDEISFLDLFAGTGSLSFEFFSRGCENITSVEIAPKMIKFIQGVSKELKIPNHIIVQEDVFSFIRRANQSFDIIFAGPPYPLENIDTIPDLVLNSSLLKKEGWFILETSPRQDFTQHKNLHNLRKYGQTHFWIFSLD
jgi:16S rRNA (guanine966-N2)-methyltransferase